MRRHAAEEAAIKAAEAAKAAADDGGGVAAEAEKAAAAAADRAAATEAMEEAARRRPRSCKPPTTRRRRRRPRRPPRLRPYQGCRGGGANAAIQAQNEAATAAAALACRRRAIHHPRRRALGREMGEAIAERLSGAPLSRSAPEKGRVTAATEARRSRRPPAPTSADVLAAEPRAGSNLAVTAEGRALQPAWTAAWGEPRWTVNDVPAGDLEDGEITRVAHGCGPGYGGAPPPPATRRLPVRGEVAAAPGGIWQPLPAVVAEAARDAAQQLASSAAGASAAAWEAAASPAAVAMCARAQFYGAILRRESAHPAQLSLSLSLPQCRTAATCRDSPAHPPHLVPVRAPCPPAAVARAPLRPPPYPIPGTRNASWALRENGPRSMGHPSPSPDLTRNDGDATPNEERVVMARPEPARRRSGTRRVGSGRRGARRRRRRRRAGRCREASTSWRATTSTTTSRGRESSSTTTSSTSPSSDFRTIHVEL